MNKMLLIIDIQNDFINEHNQNILHKIEEAINSKKYNKIIFTKFINSKNSIFYNKLDYTGCLTKQGQSLAIDPGNNYVMEKEIYSAVNKSLIEIIEENKIECVYLCGFDTECCVLKTAVDLFEIDCEVKVLSKLCGSSAGIKNHESGLEIIKRFIGKNNVL